MFSSWKMDDLKISLQNAEDLIEHLEAKIKFLEDNAFNDRAKIGDLQNKIEVLILEVQKLRK